MTAEPGHFRRIGARLVHHPTYCGAAKPRVRGVSLGRASSTDRRVRLRCARSRNAPATAPVGPSLRHGGAQGGL